MRILRGLASFPPELRPSVAALGAFDGIHLAHAQDPRHRGGAGPRARRRRGRLHLRPASGRGAAGRSGRPRPSRRSRRTSRASAGTGVDAAAGHPVHARVLAHGGRGLRGRRPRAHRSAPARSSWASTTPSAATRAATAALLRELGRPARLRRPRAAAAAGRRADRVVERHPRGAARRRRRRRRGLPRPPVLDHGHRAARGRAGAGRSAFPPPTCEPDRPLVLAAGRLRRPARAWDGRRPADAVVNVGYRPTFGENAVLGRGLPARLLRATSTTGRSRSTSSTGSGPR